MAKKNFEKAEFTKTMDNISEKSIMSANAKTTIDLPLDLIDMNPDNEKIFSMDGIQELADTISNHGFYGTIDVYKMKNGRYEISAGHRRYLAVKLLDWKTIPANVEPEPDEITKRNKLILSNLNNRNLDPIERMNMVFYQQNTIIRTLAKQKGVKVDPDNCDIAKELDMNMYALEEMIAKELGISTRVVRRLKALANIREEFVPLLRKGQMSYTVASDIAKESDGIQKIVYESMKNDGKIGGGDDEDPAATQILGTYAAKVIESAKRKAEIEKYQQMRVAQALEEGEATISRHKPEPEENRPVVKPPKEDDIPVFETEKEDEKPLPIPPINTREPEADTYEPVIEPEPEDEVEPEPEIPKNYIDRTCKIYAMQLTAAVGNDFEIEDKTAVKKSLNEMKEAIKKIEKML